MAEYIERESFKQKYLCCGYLPEMSEKEFDEFPAADVVQVVRCKDCRYLGRELDKGLYNCDNYYLPCCEPDSYCCYGRRKEETKHAVD